ncbi:universal stress protein [Herbidospora galbida]|uniref:Universal stress protein n=1 Tax=Herbidospora galbida TaxID=2575442 RepID=A0A4U3M7N6_9ACTN|nr:universal stress protein [Herbidospora galbida]TKK84292.1 universal stress protein [Herbidospora galbida]
MRQGVSTEVVAGPNATTALAQTTWLPGELLICGSSSTGPLRRVFAGDMSLKILRTAPCPVVLLTPLGHPVAQPSRSQRLPATSRKTATRP